MKSKFLAMSAAFLVAMILIVSAQHSDAQKKSEYDIAREKMVKTAVVDAGIKNPRVVESMRNTPRHEFVRSNLHDKAYLDMALPIGDKQTISSPFIQRCRKQFLVRETDRGQVLLKLIACGFTDIL